MEAPLGCAIHDHHSPLGSQGRETTDSVSFISCGGRGGGFVPRGERGDPFLPLSLRTKEGSSKARGGRRSQECLRKETEIHLTSSRLGDLNCTHTCICICILIFYTRFDIVFAGSRFQWEREIKITNNQPSGSNFPYFMETSLTSKVNSELAGIPGRACLP